MITQKTENGESYPSYLSLYKSGELKKRVASALEDLKECCLCPRNCSIDRTRSNKGECRTGRNAVVSAAFPHFGEEDCLRGSRGSGTIYFSNCNMDCVFCLNRDESSHSDTGLAVKAETLAGMMLDLQNKGCHNVNFISPEHVVPQILEALEIAAARGFSLPIVYNTSSYNNSHSLQYLDGVVDIYAADFKFWSHDLSEKYLKVSDYSKKAQESLKIMHEQVGDLILDENGIAVKGLILRHLIMPDYFHEAKSILEFVVSNVSKNTYTNLINQYHPAGDVSQTVFPELNRKLSFDEYESIVNMAKDIGILRISRRRSIFSILDESAS